MHVGGRRTSAAQLELVFAYDSNGHATGQASFSENKSKELLRLLGTITM
jgi:hypothetical protein